MSCYIRSAVRTQRRRIAALYTHGSQQRFGVPILFEAKLHSVVPVAMVSISDHYVLLLEKVIEENKALREQVKTMADTDKVALDDLHKKIDNIRTANQSAAPSRRVRQTGPSASVRVPKMCRVCFFVCVQSCMKVLLCQFYTLPVFLIFRQKCRAENILSYFRNYSYRPSAEGRKASFH